MKKRKNEQNLGEAIRLMISELGLEEKILTVQAEEAFEDMMGKYIMSYVESFYVRKNILFIHIKSPELKNELSFGKSKILEHINEDIGKQFITDVRFL